MRETCLVRAWWACWLIAAGAAVAGNAAEQTAGAEAPWVSLFNGHDLTGWVSITASPTTFSVRDGMIVSTGVPNGLLRAARPYENFELELEWRHMTAGGNAGVFLWCDGLPAVGSPFSRGLEVQILDNGFDLPGKNEWYTTHGDIFPVRGATMTPAGRISPSGERSFPSEERSKSAPAWNHYRIVANDGVLRLSVNGKEVTIAKDCVPRKGFLCLEAEGAECHFRNIRLRELPSTHPRPDQVAAPTTGFTMLYDGLDLNGWRAEPGHVGHWRPQRKPQNWVLEYDGQATARDPSLWTSREFGDFELVCDWRWSGQPSLARHDIILPSGEEARDEQGRIRQVEELDAGDSGIYLRGSTKSEVNIWCWPIGSGEVNGYRTDRSLPADVRAAVTPRVKADNPIGEWNRFVITMQGDRLTVDLNGQRVIEKAQLPGVAARGPIGLQHQGNPIEFGNILIKELNLD